MLVSTALLAATEKTYPMAAPIWVFGVLPLVVFAVFAFIVWTYRDVANRHSHKAEAHASEHAESMGASSHDGRGPNDGL